VLRAQVTAIDKDQPVEKIQTIEEVVSHAMAQPRFSALLFALFAALALILAVSGIYGVMSFSVSQRSREIGIRMALGATNKDVLKLVIGQGMTLVLVGAGAGLIVSLILSRLMESLLFGVSAIDPATLIIVPLMLACAALLACYVPARRATKLDPMVTLRYE
jgi:putative ABC transport system permease protein